MPVLVLLLLPLRIEASAFATDWLIDSISVNKAVCHLDIDGCSGSIAVMAVASAVASVVASLLLLLLSLLLQLLLLLLPLLLLLLLLLLLPLLVATGC